jgi:hypothetical protein
MTCHTIEMTVITDSYERHPAEFQNLAVRYDVHQQQIKGECPIMLIISQDEPYSHQPCGIPGDLCLLA